MAERVESDERLMAAALRAAKRGDGWTRPNPLVGAALRDRDGTLHTGYHPRFGGPHAERRLLDRLGTRAAGQVLCLTLEPCSFHGKTPACDQRVIEARPSRVVVAALDPHPGVQGRGIRALQDAGVPVEVGQGEAEAVSLNLPFYLAHAKGRALFEVKVAASLDGKVATRAGDSRWITGPEARAHVHRQRARADAVVVGAGTVSGDDPALTVRDAPGPQPSRIVVDSSLRTDPEARIWRAWKTESGGIGRDVGDSTERSGNYRFWRGRWRRESRLVLATVRGGKPARLDRFRAKGWETWELPSREGGVSLRALAARSKREGWHHLFVEAGPTLVGTLLRENLADELSLFIAPVVLGGHRGWSGSFAVDRLRSARRWTPLGEMRHGPDIELRFRNAQTWKQVIEHVHGLGRGNGPGRNRRGDP